MRWRPVAALRAELLEVVGKALAPVLRPLLAGRPGGGGWYPVVREPYTGAWQRNDELPWDGAATYFAVFACATLIAADIAKLRLRLVEEDAAGIWTETESAAFSPVLRRPNRYQNIITFVQQWISSKLFHGNTYVLKERDDRRVVRALYVLNPAKVTPLIATDRSVYYRIEAAEVAVPAAALDERGGLTVPASEVIHDLMNPLFHPLVGVSPVYACGAAALTGLKIQDNSTRLFANQSQPGGLLVYPMPIDDGTAERVKARWEAGFQGENHGRVAVVGDGLKYEPLSAVSAVDAQLIDQLRWTGEVVCSCFHVPPYMVGIGPHPPYANSEPLLQQYYSQCLQSLIDAMELCLDEGLELPSPYGTEFDVDDLIWMDTATKTKAAADTIGAGVLSPDEARRKYFGLGPVPGGSSPYLQQQYFSLEALAERDAAHPLTAPAPAAGVPEDPALALEAAGLKDLELADLELLLLRKDWAGGADAGSSTQ